MLWLLWVYKIEPWISLQLPLVLIETQVHALRKAQTLFFLIHFSLSSFFYFFFISSSSSGGGLALPWPAAAFWAALAVLKGKIKAYYIFEGGPHSDSLIKQCSHTQSQATTIWMNSQPGSSAPKGFFSRLVNLHMSKLPELKVICAIIKSCYWGCS